MLDECAVIDFGAGTGQFAVPTARRFGRVIAIDVSPAMVAALRLAASGPAGPPARVPVPRREPAAEPVLARLDLDDVFGPGAAL
jgi:SAM-dependent methyltransferase